MKRTETLLFEILILQNKKKKKNKRKEDSWNENWKKLN